MTPTAVRAAIADAKRFIKLAQQCLDTRVHKMDNERMYFDAGRDTGALRRASLDLSRALADMRASGTDRERSVRPVITDQRVKLVRPEE